MSPRKMGEHVESTTSLLRASAELGEGRLEVFHDFGGDDVGIGKVGAVFE
jgi:hypothetical protein